MNKAELESVDVRTNAQLELKVTKEDVLNVLLEKKENELVEAIEKLTVIKNENEKNSKQVIKDFILSIVGKEFTEHNHYYSRNDLESAIKYVWDDLTGYEFNNYSVYDIRHLNSVKNPTRVKEKQIHASVRTYEMSTRPGNIFSYHLIKEVEDLDGWSGTLDKRVEQKLTKQQIKDLKIAIKKVNAFNEAYKNDHIALSTLEYELLTLDTNRAFRNKLTKTIIANADLTQLLLDA
tara:strand:+ start:56 stop:760 length:705 start_codon:yes stop_codon:yes gene_type:complete